jgi:hypothetical protein
MQLHHAEVGRPSHLLFLCGAFVRALAGADDAAINGDDRSGDVSARLAGEE